LLDLSQHKAFSSLHLGNTSTLEHDIGKIAAFFQSEAKVQPLGCQK
jgi:hypothetical protein